MCVVVSVVARVDGDCVSMMYDMYDLVMYVMTVSGSTPLEGSGMIPYVFFWVETVNLPSVV